MGHNILIGSGWNSYLFRREMSSLVGIHDVIHPRILSFTSDSSFDHLTKSALLDDHLKNAEILSNISSNIDEENISQLILDWSKRNLPEGSFAIRCRKIGQVVNTISSKKIENEVGALLVSEKNKVNLENPEYEVVVVLAGLEDISSREIEFDELMPVIAWGLRVPISSNRQYNTRMPTDRPFFKPVSLEPRLARLMISLCHTPNYSPQKIIDPFCGTGGIAIEASLQGMHVLASDLDIEMIEGTINNLEWIKGIGKYEVKHCAVKDIKSMWGINKNSSFVFDPPYGRNSWKSDDGLDLFIDALKSVNSINPDGTICTMLPTVPGFLTVSNTENFLVMGKKWDELETLILDTGWTVVFKYPIKVHRSLARLLLVCHPSH